MSEQKRPVVYSLYVVNKAGGLIFHHDYSNIPKLNANDYLMLASTFHSLHAIAGQCVQGAGETKDSNSFMQGVRKDNFSMEAQNFRLECYQTLTGIKFFMTGPPNATGIPALLHSVYLLYTDYVLKNPFYEMDMPIRCESFDKELNRLLAV